MVTRRACRPLYAGMDRQQDAKGGWQPNEANVARLGHSLDARTFAITRHRARRDWGHHMLEGLKKAGFREAPTPVGS